MDRDPGDFDKRDGDATPETGKDARVDAWLASLPPLPGIKHVDDPDDDDIQRALADVAADRCHSHEVVGAWLKTAGKPDWKPFRDWPADQDD